MNLNFKSGNKYTIEEIIKKLNEILDSGKITNIRDKMACVELIKNSNESEAIFKPFSTGWGASPFNTKCWKKVNGEILIKLKSDKRKRKVFSKLERQKIFEKTKGSCYSCGMPLDINKMQIEHIIPFSRGGSDEDHNLLPSCRKCNMYRSNYSPHNIKFMLEVGYALIHEIRNETEIGNLINDFLNNRKNKLSLRNKKNRMKKNTRSASKDK